MRAPQSIIAVLVAAAAFGCDRSALQLYAPPPWPASHTVVLVWLSDVDEAVAPVEVFAPGQVVSVDAPDDAQRLLALAYEDEGGDLQRCGATLGGSRALLPEPNAIFEARALLAESGLQLNPRTLGPPLDLRFAQCEPTPEPACPELKLTTYPVPGAIDRDMHALTVFRGEIFTSATAGEGPVQHQLYRVQDEEVVPVTLPQPLGNSGDGLRAMTSDADKIWGAQGRRVFELNADLEVQTSSRAHFYVQRLISEGNGGPVVATGDNDGDGGVFDVTGQLTSINESSDGAVLAGPGQRFVLLNGAIMQWRSEAWAVAHRFDIDESYYVMGGDRTAMAAAGLVGELLLRDEAADTWLQIPPDPQFITKMRLVLSMGEGRLLLGGNDGFITLWDRDRWCTPPTRSFTNILLGGVVTQGVAYLSTSHIAAAIGDSPLIVKVEIVE